MEIDITETGGVKVLAISGKLDTNTAPDAEAQVRELIEAGDHKLLVDFASVTYVSSAGLRFLLATAKRLKAAEGVLKVCGLTPTVQEVFDISGFTTILSVLPDQSAALEAF
jgi:anti-sigma B factor antagonist